MFMHGARLMPGSACPMSTCHWDLLAQLVSAPILIHAGIFVDEGSLSMGWRSPGRAAASNEFGNSLLAALERRAAALHSDGRLYLRFLGRVQYWAHAVPVFSRASFCQRLCPKARAAKGDRGAGWRDGVGRGSRNGWPG